jgi:hypothetical protein
MAEKTPIRLVFDGSTPTGIAEYQSGDTIGNSYLTNSSFTLVDDSSTTTTISLGESLKISGDTGITSTISGDSILIDLDDTAVSPGTYGSATSIPTFTVDQQGRITSASSTSVATTLTIVDDTSTAASIELLNDTLKVSGDTGITTTVTGDTLLIDLDDTAVTPGSYGSSTAVPQITVDQQGRITSLSTAAISTSFTLAADSGSNDTFNTGDTLTISGTANEIETAVTDNTITIGLPDSVTVTSNLTVGGNLTVNGDTTTLSTTNTVVEDKLFELGNGRTGSATGDSGIIIERGDDDNVFIGYDESADVITFGTGSFTGASTGDLTLTDANIRAANISATGTLGVTGNTTLTGNLDVSGSTTLRGNLTLGVNSGDSTEDTINVVARFVSNLEPLDTLTYDLGSPQRRWRDVYLSGNTIDLNGATISGDGTGNITISATGATLPVGSKVGDNQIAQADTKSGVAVRVVPFYSTSGGLSTANTNFTMAATSARTAVFTGFTKANGDQQGKFEIFSF